MAAIGDWAMCCVTTSWRPANQQNANDSHEVSVSLCGFGYENAAFPWKSAVFYFHAALVWLLQLCGGITQSNLTTASRKDRIIIPSTALSRQNQSLASKEDLLNHHWWYALKFSQHCERERGEERFCDAIKWNLSRCVSHPGTQVTKLFPMISSHDALQINALSKQRHRAERLFMNSMFGDVVKSAEFKYYWPRIQN